MIYNYLWQNNKGKPEQAVIKGLFKEANAYMRERLKEIKRLDKQQEL